MTWRMLTPLRNVALSPATDPFMSIQRELGRMFDAMSGDVTAGVSAAFRLDVKEDDKAFSVTAELPGLSEKDVEVSFEDGILSIKGEKKVEREDKGDTWHIVERSSGSFARQLSMPKNIDETKIEAKVEKGVLHVTLPKLSEEKAKAKKIEVKGS